MFLLFHNRRQTVDVLNVGWELLRAADAAKSSVMSGFKSEMPQSELNSLPTNLGATRLRE